MAARTELKGILKQSLMTSNVVVDASLPLNRNSNCQGTVKESETSGTVNESRVRTKRSSRSRKECVNESLEHNEELVKHMSKLPGYLQRMERGVGGESVQSNVLNVGVLDWGRLEKWKHSQSRRDCSNDLFRGGERSGKSVKKVSSIAATTSGVVPNVPQHSVHRVRCTLEPELASRDSLNKEEIAACSYNSSGRVPGNSRRSRSYQESSTSGLFSEMGNSVGSLLAKEEARERPTESGNQSAEKLAGEEKIIEDSKASEKQENDQISNIVLLRSKRQSRSNLSDTRVAREVNCSVDFSNEIDSSLVSRSQIPRSCPLSFDLEERDSEDLSVKKKRFVGRRHSKTPSKIFDQEISEAESKKNRHHSPSRRFSFSFGRLSRSFSSKEDSAGQILSSSDDTVNSDSTRFNGLACPSRPSNVHCGSSGVTTSLVEFNGLPSKTSDKPPPDEAKQDTTSRNQALFQLTIRNGIPLFQFVVDVDDDDKSKKKSSSRSILGATMKSSVSSVKGDSDQYCMFYSVDEVKKKKSGSWLLRGHKEKQHKFVYNAIGRMKLSSSELSTEQKSKDISHVIRESVLYDESEQEKRRQEVAAVVIKKKLVQGNYTGFEEEINVIIPGGVHSFSEKGAPSPLINRWRSGGLCDCGGWDIGCKLHVLSTKTFLHEFDQSFKLFNQEESDHDSGPVWAMTEVKTGIYRVEFGSFLSPLQAFFVCVTVITCGSEEKVVSKTTGKSSSPFAPPLSPVGRV